MSIEKKPEKTTNLKVGMKVTTKFGPSGFEDVVRTLTILEEDSKFGSGFWASADGGEPCKCCGLSPAHPIDKMIDSVWFTPVNQEVK